LRASTIALALGTLALLAVAGVAPIGTRARAQDRPGGDADAGRTVFNRQCGACHAVQPGQNKIGPSLAGVVGRHAAAAPGFDYSPAMRQTNRSWDAQALDAYLTDPRGNVPGTRMIHAGLRDPKQRADVIAYLATLN
jgi:cytochrome c